MEGDPAAARPERVREPASLTQRLSDMIVARMAFALVVLASAFACGDPKPRSGAGASPKATPSASPASDGTGLYEATALVLESDEHGPELCLGGVMDSLPPQCGGVPLLDWDWEAVEGEEAAAGTTWGDYHVTGTYDGDTFTVTGVGPPRDSETDDDPIGTPCEEPEGGWAPVDASRSGHEAAGRAAQLARKEPDFSGVWFDYYGDTDPAADSDEEAYGDIILNVAFTGDLARHERDLRETWGGPLCLVQHERTYRELRAIQRELEDVAQELDLEILGSSTDEVQGTVEITVTAIDTEKRARLEERYGPGVIEVDARLRPVR